jgi:ABC-type cobalamin/Fe3+-siderophores transport system ATPase subunit
MQLAEFSVEGLFGRYNHRIPLPTTADEDPTVSLVVLHGLNGVGKTTVLRMLDGFMRLDFNTFRAVPFKRSELTFSTGQKIMVSKRGSGAPLSVAFGTHKVRLHPQHAGALEEEGQEAVERFREEFFAATARINFELIEATRAGLRSGLSREDVEELIARGLSTRVLRQLQGREDGPQALAEKVKRFIADAQLDYRRFFTSTGPDLFPKIINTLSEGGGSSYEANELIESLTKIHKQDEQNARLGLEHSDWNYDQIMQILRGLEGKPRGNDALIVLGVYTDALVSQAQARQLVADRLLAFERIMGEFLADKGVLTNATEGLEIRAEDGSRLTERQLSSGEYHLLYLMVSALTTRRRGTVLAIDEPELSMHIQWQRKLIRNLIECASRAAPQFILATHSPDIAADYRSALQEMGARAADQGRSNNQRSNVKT